jgi:hypothetical protein
MDLGGQLNTNPDPADSCLAIFKVIEKKCLSDWWKIIKIDKIFNFFLKFLCIFDYIVRIRIFLTDPDPRIRNSDLRIRIQAAT